MKRKYTGLCLVLIMSMAILLYPAVKVYAASASLSVTLVSDEALAGSNFTVAVQISANTALASAELTISYDSERMELISQNSLYENTSSEVVIRDPNLTDKAVQERKYILQFKALKKGKTTISIDGTPLIYASSDGTALSISKKSLNLRIYDKKKQSDNNLLTSLTVKEGSLTPDFTPDNTTYNLNVPFDKSFLTIEAVAEDSGAEVTIEGNDQLEVGTNKVAIIVKSPSGKVMEYRVYVNREASEAGIPTSTPIVNDTPLPSSTQVPPSTQEPSAGNDFTIAKEDGLTYYKGNSNYLLLVPYDDGNVPKGYEKVTLTLGGTEVTAYALDGNVYQEFLLFYAKQEGKDPGWYLLDQTEGTMQRYVTENVSATATPEARTEESDKKQYEDKIDLLGIIMAIEAGIILLLLIVVIRFIMKQKGYNDELE